MRDAELKDFEGRKLTASQILQVQQTRAANKILREAGHRTEVLEFVTGGSPRADAAGIRIRLEGEP